MKNVNMHITKQLEVFKNNYKQTGDSETVLRASDSLYNQFSNSTSLCNPLPLAAVLTFVCDLRLSQAKTIEDLQFVLRKAENAVEIILSSDLRSSAAATAMSSANLYRAVAMKAQSKKDEAFRIINEAKFDLKHHFDSNMVESILLTRQEVMMREEQTGFARLLDEVPIYIDEKPVEAYATLKRIFEFSLNNGQISIADDLLPMLNETFRRSSHRLGALAKLSYQKNMGHYYIVKGELDSARRLLWHARSLALQLGYEGQYRQICSLLSETGFSKSVSLSTFQIN